MTAVDVDLVLERADSACLCGENHVLLMLDHGLASHIAPGGTDSAPATESASRSAQRATWRSRWRSPLGTVVWGRSTGLRLPELNSCACSRLLIRNTHPGGAPKAARRLAAVGGRAAGWGERTQANQRARPRCRLAGRLSSACRPAWRCPARHVPRRRDRAWRYPPRPRGRRRSRDARQTETSEGSSTIQ